MRYLNLLFLILSMANKTEAAKSPTIFIGNKSIEPIKVVVENIELTNGSESQILEYGNAFQKFINLNEPTTVTIYPALYIGGPKKTKLDFWFSLYNYSSSSDFKVFPRPDLKAIFERGKVISMYYNEVKDKDTGENVAVLVPAPKAIVLPKIRMPILYITAADIEKALIIDNPEIKEAKVGLTEIKQN
jgi:hypothetical protein